MADYFCYKTKFSSEPKDDPTWLGEATFVFNVIQHPIPRYLGWHDGLPPLPPPSTIVIESVLPRPLDQTTTTRCLNMNHEFITLYAARVLTESLRKLEKLLKMYQSARSDLWKQGAQRLKAAFVARCPPVKVVVQVVQRTSKSSGQQRNAIVDLLASYSKILPTFALAEKFDVSSTFRDTLQECDQVEDTAMGEELLDQICSLAEIAQSSLSTHWWQPAGHRLSLGCSLLRVIVSILQIGKSGMGLGDVVQLPLPSPSVKKLQDILRNALTDLGAISAEQEDFDRLLASLASLRDPTDALAFIDNCLSRISKQPVHYLDLAGNLATNGAKVQQSNIFLASVIEQWPFVASRKTDPTLDVAEWLARYVSTFAGDWSEDTNSELMLQSALIEGSSSGEVRESLKEQCSKYKQHPLKWTQPQHDEHPEDTSDIDIPDTTPSPAPIDLPSLFPPPTPIPTSLQNLTTIPTTDLDTSITTGRLTLLIYALSSPVPELRLGALSALCALLPTIPTSTHAEKTQLYLLLGALCDTASSSHHDIPASPLPSFITSLAAQMLLVEVDPGHKLYGKVNTFLLRGPSWGEAQKSMRYWLDRILLHEPDDDDGGYSVEVEWLLDTLAWGLRTEADVEVYRRAGVFERVLALYAQPLLRKGLRRMMLGLVWRVVQAGGGLTLVTRVGVLSWLEMEGEEGEVRRELKRCIEEEGGEGVEEWKGRGRG